MRKSKFRIREALEQIPEITLRRLIDPPGDTGAFLLTTFATERMARAVNARLRWHRISCTADAVSNVILADYGLHIYSNIPALVRKPRPIGTVSPGTWRAIANLSTAMPTEVVLSPTICFDELSCSPFTHA